MIIGIVGLPNCGKTTLFNALTRGNAEIAPYAQTGAEPNQGIVKVPDVRVDRLCEIYKPKKITHASVEYIDLPGLPRGSVAEGARVTEFLRRPGRSTRWFMWFGPLQTRPYPMPPGPSIPSEMCRIWKWN